jgi:putative ATP-dependent endonuclease of the OLD family
MLGDSLGGCRQEKRLEITRVRIRNFRSIKNLDLPLGPETILVGPNNAGKTAILDAIRIALGRRWGQRGTGFTEYDIHLPNDQADPKTCGPAVVELQFAERISGEWPQEVQDDLLNVIQTDPHNRAYVTLRVSCGWSVETESYEPVWQFLDAAGTPIRSGRRVTNTHPLFDYVPIFYMSALRDSEDEFSAHSQFWGRLLRAISIPEALEARVMRVLELVNARLINSSPRLSQITEDLRVLTKVAAEDTTGDLQLRAVPLKAWDLIARSEVILRSQSTSPWLPLRRHGQGVQSLSVIFLFETFVRQLLSDIYGAGSTPILALEEPETHLHPQAARTMWSHIHDAPGQKIITTHSPYFVQRAPFRSIRLVRFGPNGTEVQALYETFTANVPADPALKSVVEKYPHLSHDPAGQLLTVSGRMAQLEMRELMTAFGNHADRGPICAAIGQCARESQTYVDDATLAKLDEWARRIRGEIFFARKWLMVEGQSEYILLHGLGRVMDYDLDRHGIAVIDYRNNGSLGPFVALARALAIPWVALVDNDLQGRRSKDEVLGLGIERSQVAERVYELGEVNLEQALLAAHNEALLRDVLATECGINRAVSALLPELDTLLDENKVDVATALADRMKSAAPMEIIMPSPITLLMLKLRDLT